MQVLTPDGYKDVSSLNIGDEVIGRYNVNILLDLTHMEYDTSDPEQQFLDYTVNGIYTFFQEQLVLLNDVEAMRHARELVVGDIILADDGSSITITSITSSAANDWWRFTVSDDHTFIADGIELHNSTITMGSAGGVLTTNANWVGGTAPGVGDDALITSSTGSNGTSLNGANWSVHSVDFTGYTGTFTSTGTRTWTVGGVATLTTASTFKLATGMTFTGGGTLTVQLDNRSGGLTLTTTGIAMSGITTFNTDANVAASAATTFADSCNLGSSTNITQRRCSNVTVTSGTTLTCNQYGIAGTAGSTTLTYSGATISCQVWTYTATNTVTLTGNSSSALNQTATSSVSFVGNGATYPGTTSITGSTAATAGTSILGANSFASLFLLGVGNIDSKVKIFANQTCTTEFKAAGNAAKQRMLVKSDTDGTTRTITVTGATVSNNINADFSDIAFSGATATGTRLGDWQGCSGITFTSPSTRYWVGDAGNMSDSTNHWASSSNGSPTANNYPLPQDTCVWDTSSFTVDGQAITMDAVRMGALDFSLATNHTYSAFNSGTSEAQTWGDIKFSSMGTINFNSTVLGAMLRSGTQQFTQNGATINMGSIKLRGISGTFQLQDDANFTSTTIVDFNFIASNTTVDTNGHNLTCGGITYTSGTGTFIGSSGKTLTFTAAGTVLPNNASLTTTGNSMNVNCSVTSGTVTFGGNGTWGDLTIPASASSFTFSINSNSTFKSMSMSSTGTRSIVFPAGVTFTLLTPKFFAGTASNLITVTSSSSGSAFTLSCGIPINTNYISLKDCTASGATPFFAGQNSTLVSGNTNWDNTRYSYDFFKMF